MAPPVMPRSGTASASPTAMLDALFEFDAPQVFVNLTAAARAFSAPGTHDPWFDQLHLEHSRPSDELARELEEELGRIEKLQRRRAMRDEEKVKRLSVEVARQDRRRRLSRLSGGGASDRRLSKDTKRLSPRSEKENRLERPTVSSLNRMPARKAYPRLREALATQEPFQVAKTKSAVNSVAAPTASSRARQSHEPTGGAKQQNKHRSTSKPRGGTGPRTPLRRLDVLAQSKSTRRARGSLVATSIGESTRQVDRQSAAEAPGNKRRRLSKVGPEIPDMRDLEELLARHNKKFKNVHHTYEPPQHSVRDVRMWERETKRSYHALSADERVVANNEIAQWLQQRRGQQPETIGIQ